MGIKLPSKASTIVAVFENFDESFGNKSGREIETTESYRIGVVDTVEGILYEYSIHGTNLKY